MITVYNIKHLTWEGQTSVCHYELFVDQVSDLPNDVYYFSSDKGRYKIAQGSVAWVVTTHEFYMMDSSGNWIKQGD